jgi:integrase
MILVVLRTGLRFGELRALRWQDVDLVGAAWSCDRTSSTGSRARRSQGMPARSLSVTKF